jgi:type I restriction enzyme S subunit
MTTLGGIAREKPNNGIFRKNPEYLTNGSEGLPVVWVEELFRGNSIDTKDSRRVTATKGEVEKYGLKKGDVLFCRSSLKLDGIAFNNVYLGEDNAALFECHLIRISPNLEDVSPVFLNWVLRSPQVRAIAKSKSKTSTMTTIDQQSLSSIPIPLPPLAEQRRIAEVLDWAVALRAMRRAALAQLDSLTQSLFLDLFGDPATNPKGWPKRELKDVCEAINDCPHTTPTWTNEGVICLRTSNLSKGGWNWDDTRYVSEAAYHERSKRGYVKDGDIVLSREGTVGIAAIVQPGMQICMGQRLVQLRPAEKTLNSEYLLRHLLCVLDPVRIGQFMVGSTSQHLNVKELRALRIPLPPISLQREFARRVTALEALKTAHRASLVEMDALFATLQHRAFRGEL